MTAFIFCFVHSEHRYCEPHPLQDGLHHEHRNCPGYVQLIINTVQKPTFGKQHIIIMPKVRESTECNASFCFSGATTGQSGPSSSGTYYPVTNQFTLGGAAISMASPMVIPSNTMHYGS